MANQITHLLVLSTCPDSLSARQIAQDLIPAKLAACVNILPEVDSFFSWKGRLDTASEHLLIIKTTVECYDLLEERIKKLHPYELPEIIAVPIYKGFSRYLDWISSNTRTL